MGAGTPVNLIVYWQHGSFAGCVAFFQPLRCFRVTFTSFFV